MFISDYTKSVVAHEVGDVHKTGNAEKGGVIFEIKNMKADQKIFPQTHTFCIFELLYGEQQIFNFLELACSDKPIHSLAQGLHEGGKYFLGVACTDSKICSFNAASPIPHSIFGFTPARTAREIFLL